MTIIQVTEVMMNQVTNKLQSRKFWIAIAPFLASLGTGISGLATGDHTLTIIGAICCVLAGAIYAACEAYVDGASVKSNTNSVTITAASSDKTVVANAVKNALGKDEAKESNTAVQEQTKE